MLATNGPFRDLRVKWQPKQNQIITSRQQTHNDIAKEKKIIKQIIADHCVNVSEEPRFRKQYV